MQIIIPMTGYGSRFVAAGYKELKPFIKVEGKSILQWIVDGMYPGEKKLFLFVVKSILIRLTEWRICFLKYLHQPEYMRLITG